MQEFGARRPKSAVSTSTHRQRVSGPPAGSGKEARAARGPTAPVVAEHLRMKFRVSSNLVDSVSGRPPSRWAGSSPLERSLKVAPKVLDPLQADMQPDQVVRHAEGFEGVGQARLHQPQLGREGQALVAAPADAEGAGTASGWSQTRRAMPAPPSTRKG